VTPASPTHPFDKLLAILIDYAPREPDLSKADVLVHLLHVLRIERAPTAAHLKEKHAQTPEIDQLRVAVVVKEDLWREVLGRAAKGVGQLAAAEVGLGEAEIA
jgi:hypothetical protein